MLSHLVEAVKGLTPGRQNEADEVRILALSPPMDLQLPGGHWGTKS